MGLKEFSHDGAKTNGDMANNYGRHHCCSGDLRGYGERERHDRGCFGLTALTLFHWPPDAGPSLTYRRSLKYLGVKMGVNACRIKDSYMKESNLARRMTRSVSCSLTDFITRSYNS
jgi:hypothetical protein